VGHTGSVDSAPRLPERSTPVPAEGASSFAALPGPAMEPGFVRAGPAPDGASQVVPHGPATVPAGDRAGEGGTARAAAGPVPPDDGRDGGRDGSGGWGWSALIRDRIQSRIVYPEEAVRRGLEGEVLLRIHIEMGGNPSEIRLARSSGARLLDDAARRGVVRAAPLPAFPGWVEVPVRFRLR
jgi:protein TonB